MTKGQSGWNSPSVILAILTLAANAGWALVAMSHADSKEIGQRFEQIETKMAQLATAQATLEERVAANRRDIERLEERRR